MNKNEIIYQISECYENPKNCKYHDQPIEELNGFYEPIGKCPFGYEELMKDCPCHNKLNWQVDTAKKNPTVDIYERDCKNGGQR